MTLHVFSGYDDREAEGYWVFRSSVLRHAKQPVRIEPVPEMYWGPQGTNAFTFSRFLVPWLVSTDAQSALFADGADMLCMADIGDLFALLDPTKAVQVVQHAPYRTRHPIKYRGTDMECPNRDYPRKNWASVMLFNTRHPFWHSLRPLDFFDLPQVNILGLRWISDDLIGALPARWNVLADEGQPIEDAAILHWTAGMPGFKEYANAPGAEHWHAAHAATAFGVA